jgi:lipopolysaccharide export system protein LptC
MSETTNTSEQTQSVIVNDMDEQAFNFMRWVLPLAALVVVASIIFSYTSGRNEEAMELEASKVFEYQNSTLKEHSEDKIQNDEFINKTLSTVRDIEDGGFFLPAFDTFYNQAKLKEISNEQIYKVVSELANKSSKDGIAFYKYSNLKAVFEEDLGQNQEAVTSLKAILSSPYILKSKVHLDLGRLHQKLGETESANKNLQIVIDSEPDSEFAKMAEYYLGKK